MCTYIYNYNNNNNKESFKPRITKSLGGHK